MSRKTVVTVVSAKPKDIAEFGDILVVNEKDGSQALYMLCLLAKNSMVAIDLKTGNRFCNPKECDSAVILEEGIPLSNVALAFSGSNSDYFKWSRVIKPKEIKIVERGAEE